MADINLPQQQGKRRKPKPPRVDLTPMVDLGFLLITFFMFTATLSEPKVMDINMPVKTSNSPTAFIDTSTITFIPAAGHKILYYEGAFKEEMNETTFQKLRDVIINKQQALRRLPNSFSADACKLHVIIKPHELSRYEDLVKILDEMLICAVPYYVIVDITEDERKTITATLP